MAVSAASTDGKAHSVQVYSDISAEWVTGDNGLLANWTTTTGSIITHQVQLQSQNVFTEVNDHTQCKLSSFPKELDELNTFKQTDLRTTPL